MQPKPTQHISQITDVNIPITRPFHAVGAKKGHYTKFGTGPSTEELSRLYNGTGSPRQQYAYMRRP